MTSKTIAELCTAAYNNSANHGFWDDYDDMLPTLVFENGPNSAKEKKYEVDVKLSKIALMHSELGEMTEGVRKPGPDQHCPAFSQEEIELADTLIRAFDYAGRFGLRLEEAVEAKMDYNQSRPYKHGKAA